jgi:hypothetical protein
MNGEGPHMAGEAVDIDFADALTGDAEPRRWNRPEAGVIPARWRPDSVTPREETAVEVVLRRAAGVAV